MTVLANRRDVRYLEEVVATASPARLLTMLYDRLARDLLSAETALGAGDRAAASASITHASDIVAELLATLDGAAWSGAAPLARLYAWVVSQLVRADVHGDIDAVVHCRGLVDELRLAWREAAGSLDTMAPTETA